MTSLQEHVRGNMATVKSLQEKALGDAAVATSLQ